MKSRTNQRQPLRHSHSVLFEGDCQDVPEVCLFLKVVEMTGTSTPALWQYVCKVRSMTLPDNKGDTDNSLHGFIDTTHQGHPVDEARGMAPVRLP